MSMTGFARVNLQDESGHLTWELRSVNHRYLEIHWRLPEHFRELEVSLRDILQQHFKRGKFDCTLKFMPSSHVEQAVTINQSLAQSVSQAGQAIGEILDNARPLSVSDILKWPGMVEISPIDLSTVKVSIQRAFTEGLVQLKSVRQTEGEKLATLIGDRITQAEPLLTTIKESADDGYQAQREKLENRLAELSMELDQQRLAQEMVYLAQKVDITEELDRLETHFSEVLKVLQRGDAIGRRLDFLMQECHREANTLGSKAIGSQSTQIAVELKVLIEQMREQVQNIE